MWMNQLSPEGRLWSDERLLAAVCSQEGVREKRVSQSTTSFQASNCHVSHEGTGSTAQDVGPHDYSRVHSSAPIDPLG